MSFKRQGDVNLHRVGEIPSDARPVATAGSLVLAEGEVTNSEHRLSVQHPAALQVFVSETGERFVKLEEPGTLTHTHDHKTITIEPGTYVQVPEREVDHWTEAVREVRD